MSSPRQCQQCKQTIAADSRFCAHCGAAQQATDPTLTPTSREAASPWRAIFEKLQSASDLRYRMIRLLGHGGMAAVYLAEDPKLARHVALKVMSPGLMVDPKLVQRFQQEARTIAQLNHPHIINIFEIDEKEGLHYFAMSYVSGRTLSQVLAEAAEPLPVPAVRAWLWQVGSALAYAHRQDIVHRDIKPENILLDLNGNTLVTDFGIAKVADSPSLTRTGIIVGTPAYMSPEQCSTGVVSGATDQYALGAVAYQMLTGQAPFTGPTLSVLQAHVSERPRPIPELRPDCPEELAAAVHRMLEKKVGDRWPSISAALGAMGAREPALDDPVKEQLAALAAPTSQIAISNPPDALVEGDAHRLEARPLDDSGKVLGDRKVRWGSDDAAVATVGADGTVRALQSGTVRLMASSGGATTEAILTVVPGTVEQVEVLPPHPEPVNAGESLQLKTVVRGGGQRQEDRAVVWNTSDPNIARVSPDGIVEAVGPGSATITASLSGRSAATVITVSSPGIPAPVKVGPARAKTKAPKVKVKKSRVPKPAAKVARAGADAAPDRSSRRKHYLIAGGVAFAALAAVAMLTLLDGPGDAGPEFRLDEPPAPLGFAPEQTPDSTGADVLVAGVGGVPGATPAGADSVTGVLADSAATQVPGTGGLTDPRGAGGTGSDLPVAGAGGVAGGAGTGPGSAGEPTESRPAATAGSAPSRPQVVAPRPAAPPADGRLRIEGDLPADAQIVATDATGRVWPVEGSSASLPPGDYALAFTAPGFEPQSAEVLIQAGETRIWAPVLTAVAPQPDPAAERALIEAEIRGRIEGFAAAFNARSTSDVLPVLPANVRDNWRGLLEEPSVSGWQAALQDYRLQELGGDRAVVEFSIGLSYSVSGQAFDQSLLYRGALERSPEGWRLMSVEVLG